MDVWAGCVLEAPSRRAVRNMQKTRSAVTQLGKIRLIKTAHGEWLLQARGESASGNGRAAWWLHGSSDGGAQHHLVPNG